MNFNLNIYLFASVICFLGISCTQNKKQVMQSNLTEQDPSESFVEQQYPIVAYSFEIESDSVPAFSIVALNLSSDFLIKTRMAFFEDRFKWDFEKQLDSAFVFGLKEDIKGRNRHINFEVWHDLDKNNTQKVIDALNTLFDKPLYYKPPTDWQWFVYQDKVFFMDGYRAGVNRDVLREIKSSYERDTLFLNYVVSKIEAKQ